MKKFGDVAWAAQGLLVEETCLVRRRRNVDSLRIEAVVIYAFE